MRAALAALMALGLAACEPPVEPIFGTENRILVHAVLDLAANEQHVLLERTLMTSTTVGIGGATVRLQIEGGGVFTATQANPGTLSTLPDGFSTAPAVYRLAIDRSTPGFAPGARFQLLVVTPQGDSISGVTTMPGAEAATVPNLTTFFFRNTDTLRLSWPRVPDARGYYVGVYIRQNSGPAWVKTYSVFADTSVAIPGFAEDIENGGDAFPRSEEVTVVVAAVDDNFHAYYRTTSAPFTGAPASRLTGGALGVFGSMVPILIRRYQVQ